MLSSLASFLLGSQSSEQAAVAADVRIRTIDACDDDDDWVLIDAATASSGQFLAIANFQYNSALPSCFGDVTSVTARHINHCGRSGGADGAVEDVVGVVAARGGLVVRDAAAMLHVRRARPRGDFASGGLAHRAPQHVRVPAIARGRPSASACAAGAAAAPAPAPLLGGGRRRRAAA